MSTPVAPSTIDWSEDGLHFTWERDGFHFAFSVEDDTDAPILEDSDEGATDTVYLGLVCTCSFKDQELTSERRWGIGLDDSGSCWGAVQCKAENAAYLASIAEDMVATIMAELPATLARASDDAYARITLLADADLAVKAVR